MVTVPNPHLRTTSMCLSVACGSRHDPAGLSGVAHMLEHLLMSSPVAGGLSFCEHVDRLGGQANAETGIEQMRFYAQVRADDADEVAALLLGAVLQLTCTTAELEREREVVFQELAAAAADPNDTVQDAILAALFVAHPAGRPVGGRESELRALTAADVERHHAEEFLRRSMMFAVTGPRALNIDLGTATGARPDHVRVTAPVPLGPVTAPDPRWPDDYAWACVGARSPAAGAKDRAVYQILAVLLGASASSPLYRRLRTELGLAYEFHAWDRAYTEAGAWRVLVGVAPGNGPDVVATIGAVLAELAERGPSAADLLAALRQSEMQLMLDAEESLEFVKLTADRGLTRGHLWSMDDELAQLRLVSADQVAAAAADVLSGLVTVVRPQR